MPTAKEIKELEGLVQKTEAAQIMMAKLLIEAAVDLQEELIGDSEPGDFEQLRIAYLYFKILLSTKEYEEYCAAVRNNDEPTQSELCAKYDNMEFVWNFWGDIFKYERSLEERAYFNMWYLQDKYYRKFFPHIFTEVVLVRNDTKITAKTGKIYITISNAHDEEIAIQLFARRKAEILALAQTDPGEFMLNLREEKGYPDLQTAKYEQAIDAMYWKNTLKMTIYQCILTAHRCNRPAWEKVKRGVEDCLKINNCKNAENLTPGDLEKVIQIFRGLKKRGEEISKCLLNEEFTSPDINPF